MVDAEDIEEITKTEWDLVRTIAEEVIEESISEKAIEDINDIYDDEGDLVYRNSDVENFYYDVGLQAYSKNLEEFKNSFYHQLSVMMLSQFQDGLEYDDEFIEAIQEARENKASLEAAIKLKIDDWFHTNYKSALEQTEDIFIYEKKEQEYYNEQERIEEEKNNRKKCLI